MLGTADTCCKRQSLLQRFCNLNNQAGLRRQISEVQFLRNRGKKSKLFQCLNIWDFGDCVLSKEQGMLISQSEIIEGVSTKVVSLHQLGKGISSCRRDHCPPKVTHWRDVCEVKANWWFSPQLSSVWHISHHPIMMPFPTLDEHSVHTIHLWESFYQNQPSFAVKFHFPNAVCFEWRLFREGSINFLLGKSIFYPLVLYAKCLHCYSSNFHKKLLWNRTEHEKREPAQRCLQAPAR